METDREKFVEVFESALAAGAEANMADFLPAASDPLWGAVLAELIRIDLEHRWGRGRPKPLSDYQRQFPGLTKDSEVFQQVAFEEYRLRRQAGGIVSPEDYRSLVGAVVDGWPDPAISAKSSAMDGESPNLWDEYQAVGATRVLPVPSAEKAALHLAGVSAPGSINPERLRFVRGLERSEPAAADGLPEVPTDLPEVGGDFLNFRLVAELGRGAFGRVFLARQNDLAERLVALKISTDIFGEAQTLAQLQHTNIVPIYSVHRADPFQAVCMPYLGTTTLADMLHLFHDRQSLPASGREFVSTLNQRKDSTRHRKDASPLGNEPTNAGLESPSERLRQSAESLGVGSVPKPPGQLALKTLEELTYVDAVLWIGARLADGLAHAHEHQIVHRDLKPANVLLADDGQPLLLDFNLSENSNLRASALHASMGGTLPYMSPEQLEVFQNGKGRVDGRSDVYSLGLILFELLTGTSPFPSRTGPIADLLPDMIADRKKMTHMLRRWNMAVSRTSESIIRHCLEPNPDRRYQSARQLQDDLERHLDNQSLHFAPQPSVRERIQKWVRRHPRLTSSSSVALLSALFIVALIIALTIRGNRLARFQAMENLALFQKDMEHAQFLLYARAPDREKLDHGTDKCRQALDRYQVLSNPEWQQLPEIRNLRSVDREQLEVDLGEMLFLASRATFLRAVYQPDEPRPDEVTLALHLNQAAERCYKAGSVPRAVWQQRAELLQYRGENRAASDSFRKAEETLLVTARDCYLAAHLQAIQGNFRKALPLLEEAVQKDPRSFSAWFVKGNCHQSLQRQAEAIACYSTCIALRPQFHWGWYNRGLAQLSHGNCQRAVADFDQAIAIQPDVAETYLNRGLAFEGMGRCPEAIRDLTKALELGNPRTQVYFLRANVREKAQDRDGAQRDRDEGVRLVPSDEQSWVARGLSRLPRDPKGALADFKEALRLNPRSFPAMQNSAHVLADHLKDDRGAVGILTTVVAFYPDNAMARAGRGVSLARLGERKQALADGEEALLLDTQPANLYQVGCIYALTSRQHSQDRLRALELLSYGLKGGFGLNLVDSDSDLDPLRKSPELRRIVDAARALHPQYPSSQ